MRDYNEEAAMLEALSHALQGFEHVVTYNGKMFDVPLLEARFRLNRVRFPLASATHLDLLHPARRLWKLRLESCRLQSLESALLGVSRRGDIPGERSRARTSATCAAATPPRWGGSSSTTASTSSRWPRC
jgi:uncharacterized protein YprB with RNaseH-like and TPR domain